MTTRKVDKFLDNLFERILIDYRWVFVCLFLLPVSAIYNVWFKLRNWIVFKFSSAPKKHAERVRQVQEQVRAWNRSGRTNYMCTGRPAVMAMSFRAGKYKSTFQKININMVDVLNIDHNKETVIVEPLANIGQVTAALNPLGWTLPVIPELDDLTVGGLIMGTGIETSSHKYGLFQKICVSLDLVLPDGSVCHCSETENSDVFHAAFWSHGTIGFLVAAELRIMKAKPFVQLNYIPCHTSKEAVEQFEKETYNEENDFVEGIYFDREKAVIMTGKFAECPSDVTPNRIGLWYKPWFYKHVERYLSEEIKRTEYIPLRDYYHRHTKSIFWELSDIIPFGDHPLFRLTLGWSMPPKITLLKQTQTATIKRLYEQKHVIQDMLVPLTNLEEAIQTFHAEAQIYPLWLCPFKLFANDGLVHPAAGLDHNVFYVDIGAYGQPHAATYSPVESTRALEAYVRSVNGFQMLYADTYMTREEFRDMFDHNLYDRVRQKYNCMEAFPEIYDKVSRKART